MSPKRPGSLADRDDYVSKHPAPATSALQLAVPHEVQDPVTGVLQGPALVEARKKRPTDERVGRLEDKHDKLDEKVDAIDSKVSRMEGKLDTALSFITHSTNQQHMTNRVRISTRGKVIIGVAGAIGVIATAVATVLAAGGCS